MDLESLHLEDGRSLEYCLSGPADPSGWLIFHVGTPSAAALFPDVTSVAEARGIRTVSYSRAGYGGSTRSAGRTVAQEAVNTGALADHLGISSFFVAGWSGGGSAALACAALLPERVRSCLVLAGNSPPEEVGAEWFTWFSEEYGKELRVLATGSAEEYRSEYEEARNGLLAVTPRELGPGGPEPDRDAFSRSPWLANALADSIHRGVAGGVDAWMDDAIASARPWGFRMRDIQVPVTIRHGELDHMVSVEHGRWLAEHIPGASADILPGHGHASIIVPFEEALDALLDEHLR